tara:strand:- start:8401 stop:9135 length:735 start_codon:yes stop_codon:yes gene_type:complete
MKKIMLYLTSLGLNDELDITLKGLEAIKKSKHIYLENYTSKLQTSKEKLEKLYKKEIILADRSLVESDNNEILKNAKTSKVSFLVIGDIFSATTHQDLLQRAKKLKIKTEIIHNTSILTAVGVTGLSLYKFGQTTSIPFNHENIKTPIEVLKKNKSIGLHTLFLLDLDPKNNKYLTAKQAAKYLIKNKIKGKCLACYQLGSDKQEIHYIDLNKVKDINKFPQCLILPGNLHFMEEEALETWNKS